MPRIVLVGAGSVEFTRNLLGDILTPRPSGTRTSPCTTSTRTGWRPRIGWRAGRPTRWAPSRRSRPTSTDGRRSAARISWSTRSRSAVLERRSSTSTCRPGSGCSTRSRTRSASAASSGRFGRSPSSWASPATWRMSVPTRGCSTTRTPWRRSSGRCRRRAPSASSGSATPSSGRWTGWPGISVCRATRSTPSAPGSTTSRSSCGSSTGAATCTQKPARVRRGRQDTGRRPRPGRALPPPRLLPDGIVRAPRRVQPVVHRQAGRRRRRGRSVPRADRRVPRPRRRQPRRVRGDEAEARRRRAFEIERSGEYAATIAEAMTTGEPARIVVNAINGGALIPNLDAEACVEVPGLVDGLGVHPGRDGRRCRCTSRRTSAARSTCRA